MTLHKPILIALTLTLALAPLPLLAMGTDSNPQQSDAYTQAKELIEAEKYAEAVPLLEQSLLEKGDYADALNLLGFAHRKLGDAGKGLAYYRKALALEPEHLGANEYLGELYLEMKDLKKAEERLAVLKSACDDCEELEDLEEAVAAYKKANGG
jgi:tetratricopeptide (TPR) repeat protein